MVWLLAVLFVGAVVVAGRAHSRYLDRLDDLHARMVEVILVGKIR